MDLDQLYNLIKNHINQQLVELLDKCSLDIITIIYPNGENLLHWAAAFDNAKMCQYLIEVKKLHVNHENYRGTTPLYYACMKNASHSVEVLLNHKANPMIRSGFSGQLPIQITNNPTIIKMLTEMSDRYIPFDYQNKLTLKQPFTLYEAYRYRLYMYWLLNLNYLSNPHKNNIQGVDIDSEAQHIYDKYGLRGLADKCQEIYQQYFDFIDQYKHENPVICLCCGKSGLVRRCSICCKVYFCNRGCQALANPLHNYDCHIPSI